jgi:hypothetical protein
MQGNSELDGIMNSLPNKNEIIEINPYDELDLVCEELLTKPDFKFLHPEI